MSYSLLCKNNSFTLIDQKTNKPPVQLLPWQLPNIQWQTFSVSMMNLTMQTSAPKVGGRRSILLIHCIHHHLKQLNNTGNCGGLFTISSQRSSDHFPIQSIWFSVGSHDGWPLSANVMVFYGIKVSTFRGLFMSAECTMNPCTYLWNTQIKPMCSTTGIRIH